MKRCGYFGPLTKISKLTYRIGESNTYVYFRLQKQANKEVESLLMVKSNVSGEKSSMLRKYPMEGEQYFEFEAFARAVIVKGQ